MKFIRSPNKKEKETNVELTLCNRNKGEINMEIRMTFNEFNNEIVNRISDYLQDIDIKKIELTSVLKNNDLTLVGLVIMDKANTTIAPQIYLNNYYEEYMKGKPLNEILEEIAYLRTQKIKIKTYNFETIENYNDVKHLIYPKLIN